MPPYQVAIGAEAYAEKVVAMLTAYCITYIALLSLYLTDRERRHKLWPGSPLPSPVLASVGCGALAGSVWCWQHLYGWEVGMVLWALALGACGLMLMWTVGFWPRFAVTIGGLMLMVGVFDACY